MKRWIFLGSGLGIVVLGAAAWGLHSYAPATSLERSGSARDGAGVSPLRSRLARSDGDETRRMAELLADRSPSAWNELVSLYPSSDDATKRKVLERISKLERFDRTLVAREDWDTAAKAAEAGGRPSAAAFVLRRYPPVVTPEVVAKPGEAPVSEV